MSWDVDRAVDLYRQGGTLDQLSDEFGRSPTAIRNQLVKAGVTMRTKRLPRPDVDTKLVLKLREIDGLSWRAIGERVGLSTPGAKSRYLAGVRDRRPPFQPWAELLRTALSRSSSVEVAALVEDHLGRVPTRAEMIAARRAAGTLEALGQARRLHITLARRHGSGVKRHLVLARPDAVAD